MICIRLKHLKQAEEIKEAQYILQSDDNLLSRNENYVILKEHIYLTDNYIEQRENEFCRRVFDHYRELDIISVVHVNRLPKTKLFPVPVVSRWTL